MKFKPDPDLRYISGRVQGPRFTSNRMAYLESVQQVIDLTRAFLSLRQLMRKGTRSERCSTIPLMQPSPTRKYGRKNIEQQSILHLRLFFGTCDLPSVRPSVTTVRWIAKRLSLLITIAPGKIRTKQLILSYKRNMILPPQRAFFY